MAVVDLKFQIDQLRKEKIMYAIEMVAAIAYLAVIPQFLDNFLGTLMGDAYFAGNTRVTVFKVASGLGVAFLLYIAAFGAKAFLKLKRLERELYKE